jgi:hypothetical protein
MVRWGGEERDGIDIGQLEPHLGAQPRLRAGEGHFGAVEYARPLSQVMEYLACSYHVSWFPRQAKVLSETTYFAPMPRHSIVKKAVLALAAGAGELAYCPCVDGFVSYQWFVEHDRALFKTCADAFVDKAAMFCPIRVLRTPMAASGDPQPGKRVHDRRYCPLFSLAGLFSTIVRQGSWRDDDSPGMLAITGRSAWDVDMAGIGAREVIVDGTALVENAPLNRQLGITAVHPGADGALEVAGAFTHDGLLLKRDNIWIIPYIWNEVPQEKLPALLLDLRRALGPGTGSAYVEGDLNVLVAHHRYSGHDSLMAVNLTDKSRRVTLHLPADRNKLASWDGKPVDHFLVLGPHEVGVFRVT